jgi:hypothetical protein
MRGNVLARGSVKSVRQIEASNITLVPVHFSINFQGFRRGNSGKRGTMSVSFEELNLDNGCSPESRLILAIKRYR